MGVTDGSDAAPGQIGEYITNNNTATAGVTPPTVQPWGTDITISLTAGDWDVGANVEFWTAPVNTHCYGVVGPSALANSTVANWPELGWFNHSIGAVGNDLAFSVGPVRFNLTTTTTIAVIVGSTDATAATKSVAVLWARRAR